MGDEKELSSRGYLALGIGYSLLASEGSVFVILRTIKKNRFRRLALIWGGTGVRVAILLVASCFKKLGKAHVMWVSLETFGLSVIQSFYLQKGRVRFNAHGRHLCLGSKEAGSLTGCVSVLNLARESNNQSETFHRATFS